MLVTSRAEPLNQGFHFGLSVRWSHWYFFGVSFLASQVPQRFSWSLLPPTRTRPVQPCIRLHSFHFSWSVYERRHRRRFQGSKLDYAQCNSDDNRHRSNWNDNRGICYKNYGYVIVHTTFIHKSVQSQIWCTFVELYVRSLFPVIHEGKV